jgi:hypothetical protein
MISSKQFNAFVASRGDGLHPKLRELLERTAACPFLEVTIRHDGMLQAGPNPASEAMASLAKVTAFPRGSTSFDADGHESGTAAQALIGQPW